MRGLSGRPRTPSVSKKIKIYEKILKIDFRASAGVPPGSRRGGRCGYAPLLHTNHYCRSRSKKGFPTGGGKQSAKLTDEGEKRLCLLPVKKEKLSPSSDLLRLYFSEWESCLLSKTFMLSDFSFHKATKFLTPGPAV